MATMIVSLLSRIDVPRNAIAVLTCIVRPWLLNGPDATDATSAADADPAPIASAATIRMVFIDAPLLRGKTILPRCGNRVSDRPGPHGTGLSCRRGPSW